MSRSEWHSAVCAMLERLLAHIEENIPASITFRLLRSVWSRAMMQVLRTLRTLQMLQMLQTMQDQPAIFLDQKNEQIASISIFKGHETSCRTFNADSSST